MVTLHEVITFLVSMQISISSLQTHNVNRCGRSRHLARKLSLRRKRSSPNVFEMAATETITSIILIKLIRVSLGTVRHPRRFKIVVIDIQITLKQMLRDFIGIDRKSGSAGMPRPSSYAVFCLKKKQLDVDRLVAEAAALEADVRPLAVLEPRYVVARTDVNRVGREVVAELRFDLFRLRDLLRLHSFPTRRSSDLPRRFKIVVIDIQITLKQMLRDFIG